MDYVIRKCIKCGRIGVWPVNAQPIHGEKGCNGNAIKCNISYEEFCTMCDIADENDFYQAMIDLKEKDLIEYQMKMSQFRTQVQQQQQLKRARLAASSTTVKCPTCNSRDVKRISGTSRAAGAAMFGLFSKTVRSQFECRNCGYKW